MALKAVLHIGSAYERADCSSHGRGIGGGISGMYICYVVTVTACGGARELLPPSV